MNAQNRIRPSRLLLTLLTLLLAGVASCDTLTGPGDSFQVRIDGTGMQVAEVSVDEDQYGPEIRAGLAGPSPHPNVRLHLINIAGPGTYTTECDSGLRSECIKVHYSTGTQQPVFYSTYSAPTHSVEITQFGDRYAGRFSVALVDYLSGETVYVEGVFDVHADRGVRDL